MAKSQTSPFIMNYELCINFQFLKKTVIHFVIITYNAFEGVFYGDGNIKRGYGASLQLF